MAKFDAAIMHCSNICSSFCVDIDISVTSDDVMCAGVE